MGGAQVEDLPSVILKTGGADEKVDSFVDVFDEFHDTVDVSDREDAFDMRLVADYYDTGLFFHCVSRETDNHADPGRVDIIDAVEVDDKPVDSELEIGDKFLLEDLEVFIENA